MRKLTTFIVGTLTALFIPSVWADYTNANGIAAIAAGNAHTCTLSTAGGVKCWGANGNGQLGDNSITTRLTPVAVTGLASGVTAIAVGYSHTCALTTAGGVKCWGANSSGQLGDNSTTTRLTPVDVTGLTSGVTAIATGGGASASHTCAITTAGSVKCWGANDWGQLGDNSGTTRLTPVAVTGLASGVASIAVGVGFTCALTTAGGVKCWGWNAVGSLGDNSGTTRLTPVDVMGLTSGVIAIAAGNFHSCAITVAGGVKCWGYNYDGEVGDNSTTNRWSPVDVSGLASGVVAISVGGDHACALTTTGGVKCWGYNSSGELGDNSTTNRWSPVNVTGLASGMAAITTGNYHTCALTTASSAKCWGWNASGQLGDNSNTDRLTPVNVVELATDGATLISFSTGWNIVGNSVNAPLDVATTLADASKVASVWKWVSTGAGKWAFFSPALTGQALSDYAASKGYDVLTTINAGEGFWVSAKTAFTAQLPAGAAVASTSFQNMSSGWHLIATGDSQTPGAFNTALSVTPPAAGAVPQNVKTLWTWDNAQSKWYFYAPSLEANGGTALTDYITSHGYLDFTSANKTLGAGVGFWVNMP